MKDKKRRPDEANEGGVATREKLKGKAYEAELDAAARRAGQAPGVGEAQGAQGLHRLRGTRRRRARAATIKAITERVSPRVFRVVALPAPTEREKSQMYVQRYLPHLPAAGEVVIFDRSWYNRAGVERVMGFCSETDVKEFLQAVPQVERAMVDSGIHPAQVLARGDPGGADPAARVADRGRTQDLEALAMDLLSYSRWYDYSRARDDMFAATDTPTRPGTWSGPTTSVGPGSTSSPTC